jgi:hypothetical protein
MNIYTDEDMIDEKFRKECKCLEMVFGRLSEYETPSFGGRVLDEKITPELLEELRITRCLLERILRVFDENKFTDYQLEKFNTSFKQDRSE